MENVLEVDAKRDVSLECLNCNKVCLENLELKLLEQHVILKTIITSAVQLEKKLSFVEI